MGNKTYNKNKGATVNWYTMEMCTLRENIDNLNKLYKINRSDKTRTLLLEARRAYRLSIYNAKKSNIENRILNAKNKSKTTWDIINNVLYGERKSQCNIDSEGFSRYFFECVKDIENRHIVFLNM